MNYKLIQYNKKKEFICRHLMVFRWEGGPLHDSLFACGPRSLLNIISNKIISRQYETLPTVHFIIFRYFLSSICNQVFLCNVKVYFEQREICCKTCLEAWCRLQLFFPTPTSIKVCSYLICFTCIITNLVVFGG